MTSRPAEPAINPATVANNFVNQYGKARLKRFLKLLQQNESGEKIAEEFGVSRERVRQWKNAFGAMVQTYEMNPEIMKLAGLK
ncbi:MAG: helix-turn-helix domain-containing protein [Planctomycetes bacterium]|nr:helix-turn-helix domain-containing protein [Planctomycetota bacterium]